MARFDESKTMAAILYLASKTGRVDLYALLKVLYFADKTHLQRWGRKITGDQYVRMTYGPVPSAVYHILKAVRGDGDWRRDLSGYLKVEGNVVCPLREPDLEELSDSDLEALDDSFAEHAHKDFSLLKRDSHDEVFSISDSFYIRDEDLAEGDKDLIQHLREQEEDERRFEAR